MKRSHLVKISSFVQFVKSFFLLVTAIVRCELPVTSREPFVGSHLCGSSSRSEWFVPMFKIQHTIMHQRRAWKGLEKSGVPLFISKRAEN